MTTGIKPKKTGYITPLQGQPIKVEILDETLSGKFVVQAIGECPYGLGEFRVPKSEVTIG